MITDASKTSHGRELNVKNLRFRKNIYLRGAYDLNRMDDESCESMYGKLDVFVKGEGINYEVVDVFRFCTFRWLCHLEEMGGNEATDL